jgi:hypothetical protein
VFGRSRTDDILGKTTRGLPHLAVNGAYLRL